MCLGVKSNSEIISDGHTSSSRMIETPGSQRAGWHIRCSISRSGVRYSITGGDGLIILLQSTMPEDSYSIAGAMLNGKAVYSGYAVTFDYFMYVLGIEHEHVSGHVTNSSCWCQGVLC